MKFFRRFSYSLSFAIAISALSALFYRIGGEVAAVPGILLEGLVNVVIVEVTRNTFAGFVNRWVYFNVIFYTAVIYFVSLAASAITNEKEALKAAGDGSVVAEIFWASVSWQWSRGYVYLGSQLLAVQQSGVFWMHEDPVTKSKRVTNSAGTVVSTIELDPWGADTSRSNNAAFQPRKFTSYTRDNNGSDEAMFRRYNATTLDSTNPILTTAATPLVTRRASIDTHMSRMIR